MTETIRLQMLRQCERVDRLRQAYLRQHPEAVRYCYTCQTWLANVQEEEGHDGHSIN